VYSSAGFNSFGYKAGCAFATGNATEALLSPAGARYLCDGREELFYQCTHDHVSSAMCQYDVNRDYHNPDYEILIDFVEGSSPLQSVCSSTYKMARSPICFFFGCDTRSA
jgi:hypothetical protein